MKKILVLFVLLLIGSSLSAGDTKGYFAWSMRQGDDRIENHIFVFVNTSMRGYGLVTVIIDWNNDWFNDDGEVGTLYTNKVFQTDDGVLYEGGDWDLLVNGNEASLTIKGWEGGDVHVFLIRTNLVPKVDT